MRVTVVLLSLVLLAACSLPVQGKDSFRSAALSKSSELTGNYHAIARCFDETRTFRRPTGGLWATGGSSDSVKIYNELGVAEYQDAIDNHWYQLIEFQKIDADRTKVDAYAVNADNLDRMWKTIEGCAKA